MGIEDWEYRIRSKQQQIIILLQQFTILCERNVEAAKTEESFDINQAKYSLGSIEEEVEKIRILLHPV